jgi:thiopeptide-type bacteriocin biosynthesis protein
MPADHLTTVTPHQAVAGVLAVLGGMDLNAAAMRSDMDPVDLAEALQVYQAAGLTALERRAEEDWYQLRIQFADWEAAESVGAEQLGPCLDQLQASGALAGWWFLRKHPCWRLRIRGADIDAVDDLLDELTARGALARWWSTMYEPETAAFGGSAGMNIAHEMFCADSRGVLDHIRQPAPNLGRRELSVLLISALLRAAGLDWFEHGDVFSRVAEMRPAPAAADAGRVGDLARTVRTLLVVPTQADSSLFATGGPIAHARSWLVAFESAGRGLGRAAADGRLDRGIRAVLTHGVIHHWNRLGLSATTQGILARAASEAALPAD